MLTGFKNFILRGNVIDLAVGVVVGAAFSSVTSALVESVINPFIGGLVGKPSFDEALNVSFGIFGEPATIKFGVLLTAVINFLLVAAALYFMVVAPLNKLAERKAAGTEVVEKPAAPTAEELLTEIRDLLASK